MTSILAIDQSTSATKAVLFDLAGRVVDKASREHRQIYPQPGWVEHDAEEIWQNVLTVVGEVIGRRPDGGTDIVALAITNQRETFVVFDRRTGRPLHNAIVWQCRRGDALCDELRDAGREELVRSKTGLKLDTYFSGSKIGWLLRENAVLSQKLQNGEALLGTIDTYLIYRLTGDQVFATDPTNASRTLLYDINKLRWDVDLCDLFEVPIRAVADVRESFSTRFGETDINGRLPCAVPICGVMGDSQASLFAQRCFQPGMAKATFGSGTSVLLNIGNEASPTRFSAITALAWVRDDEPTYALEGIINYSSATISWLKDQLGLIQDAADSEALARSVDDNGGVYFVPAFAGLSAPHWSSDARAAIIGMSAHTSKAHIVRAALESIAYQINDVLTMLGGEADVVPQVLFADGGPTRNKFLMQFTADITGADIVVSDVPECSALGAAMACMLGLGLVDSLATFATQPRDTHTYRRQMDAETVACLNSGWRAAVRRVL